MRISPLVLVLGIAASTASIPGMAQRQPVDPASAALVKEAEALLEQGKLVEADDTLEAALVIDPKNEDAFTAMAKVAIHMVIHVIGMWALRPPMFRMSCGSSWLGVL